MGCPVCKEVLESHALKMEHIVIEHPGRKILNCRYCDFKCLRIATLRDHRLKNHPNENHVENLKLIKKEDSGAIGHKCKHCDGIFDSKTLRFNHVEEMHPDRRLYYCPFCKTRFFTESQINIH